MTRQTIGFKNIKGFFENVLKNGALAHAYIFSGQEMIGKKTFAIELANLINHKPETIQFNGDVLLIDNKDSITIEEMRNAKHFCSLSSSGGRYKFLVVNNAHNLTREAQNAFLKLLEEPSASTVIFLITHQSESLLPTIFSRCQNIHFPSQTSQEIAKVLNSEKVEMEKAKFLSEFSNGRLGLALTIARGDQYAEIKKHLKELADIKKSSIDARLAWAKKITETENPTEEINKRILNWMLYLRMQRDPKNSQTLAKLIRSYHTLTQSQYNTRLMLENLLMQL